MPVKIKNKLSEVTIDIEYPDLQKYNTNVWEIVEQTDLYHVYESINGYSSRRLDLGIHEKAIANSLLAYNMNAFVEKVPDIHFPETFLETKNPIIIPKHVHAIPHPKKVNIETFNKALKWTLNKTTFIIVSVIIGISGTVIGGLLLICFLNYLRGRGFHI